MHMRDLTMGKAHAMLIFTPCLRKDDLDDGTDGSAMLASIIMLTKRRNGRWHTWNCNACINFFFYSLEIPREAGFVGRHGSGDGVRKIMRSLQ